MRIDSIRSYGMYNRINHTNVLNQKRVIREEPQTTTVAAPAFKGCAIGKIAGFILGTAAVCVFAPPLAMMGLGGVGALPGMMLGNAVDEEIDKYNESKKD